MTTSSILTTLPVCLERERWLSEEDCRSVRIPSHLNNGDKHEVKRPGEPASHLFEPKHTVVAKPSNFCLYSTCINSQVQFSFDKSIWCICLQFLQIHIGVHVWSNTTKNLIFNYASVAHKWYCENLHFTKLTTKKKHASFLAVERKSWFCVYLWTCENFPHSLSECFLSVPSAVSHIYTHKKKHRWQQPKSTEKSWLTPHRRKSKSNQLWNYTD